MREETEETENIVREIMERINRKEVHERGKKIEESKYNSMHKDLMTEEMSRYLRGRRKKRRG